MFKQHRNLGSSTVPAKSILSFGLEELEGRQMLSASGHHHGKAAVHHATKAVLSATVSSVNNSKTTFGDLQTSDAAAATELSTLASAKSLTIDATQNVRVYKVNSTTTYYAVTLTPTAGTVIRLVSDENGNAVSPPTSSTTTFADASIPGVASGEITTLAGVLGATLPAGTDSVRVVTANGLTTYSISLAPSSGTGHKIHITVDAAGNPAGEMKIPFSAVPTLVSGGLTKLAGTTTIPTTQNVLVSTAGGVTTYTIRLTSTGESLRLTVDTTGAAADPAHGGFGFGFGGHRFHGFGGFGFGHHGGGDDNGNDNGGDTTTDA